MIGVTPFRCAAPLYRIARAAPSPHSALETVVRTPRLPLNSAACLRS